MPNPKGHEATLSKFKPKWHNGETRTIRVPIALADQILEYAHNLDEAVTQENQDRKNFAIANQVAVNLDTLTQLLEVLELIENSNRFTRQLRAKLSTQVIKPLKSLTQEDNEPKPIL